MSLPWLPGMFRALLMSDAAFLAVLPANRLVFKAPADVSTLFGRVQVLNANPIDGDLVGWRPHVQFDAFLPQAGTSEQTVWRPAVEAMRVFRTATNIAYESVHYSCHRITDGPISLPDTSRGDAQVLSRAIVRAQFTVTSH